MNGADTLNQKVSVLPNVGAKRKQIYERLGIITLGDLMNYFPRDYLDMTEPKPIYEAPTDEPTVIKATVMSKAGAQIIPNRHLTVYKLAAADDSGAVGITLYNTKYTFDSLNIGSEYYFYGKLSGGMTRREMSGPQCFPAADEAILPIYGLTEGMSNNMLSGNMRSAIAVCAESFDEPLPEKLRSEHSLCHMQFAMQNIHFPESRAALELARSRLIFQEMLTFQLGLIMLGKRSRAVTDIKLRNTDISEFTAALPFTLTNGQQNAVADGLADMQKDYPMNRLVQGDVGSGKTMVAAALAYACIKNGFQTAVMAPTQILAEQHYKTFSKLFEPLGIKVCLLVGGQTAAQREEILKGTENGENAVIIGTHALVQENVKFRRLGLVVTDEQHRFGVAQRAVLAAKGENPHLLVMSATPIPRTLALIIYGDLDISVIRELPAGRQTTDTLVINSQKRGRALGFIKKEIDSGRQAYIVCPLIDENESELVSIEDYAKALGKTPLKDYQIGYLYGRMKPKEKETLMRSFSENEIKILISTTVVEVGIDVPNATVMMIENAERFGLSQLHQLRGRVGRGSEKSYCILVSDKDGGEVKARLKVMKENSDGFKIAEEDLKLRGPGDFFGFKQHGLPPLKLASLYDDIELLHKTQNIAREILASDENLESAENKGLSELVNRLFAQNGQASVN